MIGGPLRWAAREWRLLDSEQRPKRKAAWPPAFSAGSPSRLHARFELIPPGAAREFILRGLQASLRSRFHICHGNDKLSRENSENSPISRDAPGLMFSLSLPPEIDEPFGGEALLCLPGRAESPVPRHDTTQDAPRLLPCLFAKGTAVAKGSQGPLQLVHKRGPNS
jgi:hypothetical protein